MDGALINSIGSGEEQRMEKVVVRERVLCQVAGTLREKEHTVEPSISLVGHAIENPMNSST